MAGNSKRQTVGTANAVANNASGAPSPNTKPVKKKNTQSGTDPSVKANRKGVLERNGFKGAPQVAISYPNAPEAAQEGRNVYLVPSAVGNRDFYNKRAAAAEGNPIVGPAFPPGSWRPHPPQQPKG